MSTSTAAKNPLSIRPQKRQVRPDDLMPASGATARGLLLATVLAALAGMVDATGFLRLGHIFVSYMSGNSTQFAVALSRRNTAEAGAIAEIIVFFVLGAAIGQVLARISGRWHLTTVLALVAAFLAVAAAMAAAPPLMVLAMGALNAAMHRAGNLSVSLTYVTGTLVKLGQGLGEFLMWRVRSWEWLVQAAPWAGIVAGATFAGALYIRLGADVLWVAAGAAAVLSFVSAFIAEPD